MNKYLVKMSDGKTLTIQAVGWKVGPAGELSFWSLEEVAPGFRTIHRAIATGQWHEIQVAPAPIDPQPPVG